MSSIKACKGCLDFCPAFQEGAKLSEDVKSDTDRLLRISLQCKNLDVTVKKKYNECTERKNNTTSQGNF